MSIAQVPQITGQTSAQQAASQPSPLDTAERLYWQMLPNWALVNQLSEESQRRSAHGFQVLQAELEKMGETAVRAVESNNLQELYTLPAQAFGLWVNMAHLGLEAAVGAGEAVRHYQEQMQQRLTPSASDR
ncbi:MAG: hypothetical protein EBQ76_00250 [Betaproteobacteria bacterium]|nr:hypothetical protein [Betaproteobacteria bacterium]NBY13202.1 hypothetical protein [Betaproteobacteria bacterium]